MKRSLKLVPGYDSTISGNQSVHIDTKNLKNYSTVPVKINESNKVTQNQVIKSIDSNREIIKDATTGIGGKDTQVAIDNKDEITIDPTTKVAQKDTNLVFNTNQQIKMIKNKRVDETINKMNKIYIFTLPVSGLYQVRREPTQRYLVETDPRFTNYKNFISSDYLLEQLNYSPDKVQKRLGDGFYEQQLVKNQILEKMGANILSGYENNEEQFKKLLENGAKTSRNLELSMGITLTAEQINALTEDIIWLEEREVEGEKVLAPVVYLANGNHGIIKEGGAIISGGKVRIEATENVLNRNVIKSNHTLDISGNNIINQGGIIKAENELNLIGKENIFNQNATISGQDIFMEAGADIRNELIKTAISYGDTAQAVIVNQDTSITALGDLKIDVKRDFVNTGSKITANDIIIDAGRNIEIGTSVSENKIDTWDKSHKIHEEKINTTSQIDATGNLAINAKNNIDIKGSILTAQENISLTSRNNLNITSAVDTTYDKDKLDYGYIKLKETETIQNKNILSSLDAGENITLNSNNNMHLKGVQVTAQDKIDILLQGKITLENVKDEIETKEYKRISGGWAKTNTDNETVIGTNLAANGDISIKADGDNSKIQITSSQVTSQNGEINVEAAKDITIDSATEKHEREYISHQKKSGAFSSKTTDIYDYQRLDAVIGSDLSGEKIKIKSGNDLTLQAGTIVATNEVNLQAKKDIQITSATQTSASEYIKEVRKSGIFGGGGLGITIGKQKQKDSYAQRKITNKLAVQLEV